MKIINIDLFYIQLIKSVSTWYDDNYKERDNKKMIHINKVMENYEPLRFKEAKNLCKERKKFLNEMQCIVWEEDDDAVNF